MTGSAVFIATRLGQRTKSHLLQPSTDKISNRVPSKIRDKGAR